MIIRVLLVTLLISLPNFIRCSVKRKYDLQLLNLKSSDGFDAEDTLLLNLSRKLPPINADDHLRDTINVVQWAAINFDTDGSIVPLNIEVHRLAVLVHLFRVVRRAVYLQWPSYWIVQESLRTALIDKILADYLKSECEEMAQVFFAFANELEVRKAWLIMDVKKEQKEKFAKRAKESKFKIDFESNDREEDYRGLSQWLRIKTNADLLVSDLNRCLVQCHGKACKMDECKRTFFNACGIVNQKESENRYIASFELMFTGDDALKHIYSAVSSNLLKDETIKKYLSNVLKEMGNHLSEHLYPHIQAEIERQLGKGKSSIKALGDLPTHHLLEMARQAGRAQAALASEPPIDRLRYICRVYLRNSSPWSVYNNFYHHFSFAFLQVADGMLESLARRGICFGDTHTHYELLPANLISNLKESDLTDNLTLLLHKLRQMAHRRQQDDAKVFAFIQNSFKQISMRERFLLASILHRASIRQPYFYWPFFKHLALVYFDARLDAIISTHQTICKRQQKDGKKACKKLLPLDLLETAFDYNNTHLMTDRNVNNCEVFVRQILPIVNGLFSSTGVKPNYASGKMAQMGCRLCSSSNRYCIVKKRNNNNKKFVKKKIATKRKLPRTRKK